MSELKIDKARPINQTGTIQLCDSGDTITIPAGATFANSGTTTGLVPGDIVKVSHVKYEGRDSHGSTHTWYALTGLNLSHQAASTNNRLLFLAQNIGTLNPGGSSFSYRFIKKNITPNKKINGNISKTIDGIFNIVKNIGKKILLSEFSKCFNSSKICKKKLKKIKITPIIKMFFKNNLLK